MNKIIKGFLIIILLGACSFAATMSNNSITFQGYLTDSAGAPVFGVRYMGFKVFSSSGDPSSILADDIDVRPVVVYNGNYATKIVFSNIDMTAINTTSNAWVQVWVSTTNDGAGIYSDSKRMNPRIQLTAVPYALSVRGLYYDNENKFVGIGTTTPVGKLTVMENSGTDLYFSGTDTAKITALNDISFKTEKTSGVFSFVNASNVTVASIDNQGVKLAAWNDLAEFRIMAKTQKSIPGKVYVATKEGLKLSSKRAEIGTIGVCSDSYGISLGGDKKDKNKAPIAISGWVLAYVDKDYSIGTALTSGPNGNLTAMTKREKRDYPERIVGIVDTKPEKYNNIKVDGRYWVKVK